MLIYAGLHLRNATAHVISYIPFGLVASLMIVTLRILDFHRHLKKKFSLLIILLSSICSKSFVPKSVPVTYVYFAC